MDTITITHHQFARVCNVMNSHIRKKDFHLMFGEKSPTLPDHLFEKYIRSDSFLYFMGKLDEENLQIFVEYCIQKDRKLMLEAIQAYEEK